MNYFGIVRRASEKSTRVMNYTLQCIYYQIVNLTSVQNVKFVWKYYVGGPFKCNTSFIFWNFLYQNYLCALRFPIFSWPDLVNSQWNEVVMLYPQFSTHFIYRKSTENLIFRYAEVNLIFYLSKTHKLYLFYFNTGIYIYVHL